MFAFFVNIYMNEFDKLYEETLEAIEEGRFKGLATAGLIGLSALSANAKGDAHHKNHDIQSKQKSSVMRQDTKMAKLRELKILAQQAIANNDEKGFIAIEAEVKRLLKS